MKKKPLQYKFNSLSLDAHAQRIVSYFSNYREAIYADEVDVEDVWPTTDYIADNGEGYETWIIDVPCIEESYLYANKDDRDTDYRNLTQLIDLILTY